MQTHTHTVFVATQSVEFELSSSQDPDAVNGGDVQGGGRKRRKKASIASRSILV